MKFSTLFKILLVVLFCGNVGNSSRILGIFSTETKSHYIMYGKVLHAMAEKGHNVTVITHFPGIYSHPNYKEISVKGLAPLPNVDVNYFTGLSHLDNVFDIINTSLLACKALLSHQPVLDQAGEQYDLFVVEMFGSDCFLPLAYKIGAPIVGMISSVTLPWANDMVANPDDTSYIHSYFYPFTQRMSLFQRIENTIVTTLMKYSYQYYSNTPSQELAEKALGPVPPIEEIAKNISMILVNSHYSISQIKPWVPQMVEVGGLHINDHIEPLPKDIEAFMRKSKGIIYLSFGTIFPIDKIPEKLLLSFFKAFETTKEGVIWKANTGQKRNNILEKSWLPQIPILCNPSTKLFISHGGLLSLQEAVYCGVPVLGIPFFADQRFNLMALKEKGIARILEYKDVSDKSLLENFEILLNDKSYTRNAKLHSETFKDRPIHPLNLSVYWMEHVLKYKGAKHLKSPALELEWYQYKLLDVYLILISIVLLVLFSIYKLIVKIKCLCTKFAMKIKKKVD